MWALFDHLPAPSYYKADVAILGDAAHASTPHQGAGAGQALEDALIMSELLADVRIKQPTDIPTAFRAYDAVRRPRSQHVVTSSRAAGELYGFQSPAGSDIELVKADLLGRYQWIWENDLTEQLRQAEAHMTRENVLTDPSVDNGLSLGSNWVMVLRSWLQALVKGLGL